jgi:hypothetical protein
MRRMQTTVITGQFENALTNEHVQLNDKVPNLAFFRNKIEQDEDIADKLDCVDFLRHFWGGRSCIVAQFIFIFFLKYWLEMASFNLLDCC